MIYAGIVGRVTFLFVACVTIFLSSGPTPAADDKPVLEASGYLVAPRRIEVRPHVTGEVVELAAEEGKLVKAGEVLARLEATPYTARLYVAQARVQRARARLVMAKQGNGPPTVPEAEADLQEAEARLRLAKYELDGAQVRAPFDGTVLALRARVGERVNPDGLQTPTAVCELADLRELEAEVWVIERDRERIFPGQKCRVKPTALPKVELKGEVSRLVPAVDRARGAFPVRIKVQLPNDGPGLMVDAQVTVAFLDK